MPSHKKKILSIIIFNLAISLIVANKITNLIFNNILLEIPTYLITAGISFTILSVIAHKIWKPTIKTNKPNVSSPIIKKEDNIIIKEQSSETVKNLKLTRILKKKL